MIGNLPRNIINGNTPIVVRVADGITEDGEQDIKVIFAGECYFDESSKTVRGKDGLMVTLSGLAIINGDIAPDCENITGDVQIGGGGIYKVHRGRRIRGLGGAVHHTELELI